MGKRRKGGKGGGKKSSVWRQTILLMRQGYQSAENIEEGGKGRRGEDISKHDA